MWTEEAIADLYKQHSYAVFRRCRSLLRDDAEARDLMHEVFVRALEQKDRFKGRSSVATFLFAVATHLCLNQIRNRLARGAHWRTTIAWEFENPTPAPDRALSAAQLWNAVLAESDDSTAQIAVYHFVDGLSQGEIAALVGLSRVTVNQRLQSFRSKARRIVVFPVCQDMLARGNWVG